MEARGKKTLAGATLKGQYTWRPQYRSESEDSWDQALTDYNNNTTEKRQLTQQFHHILDSFTSDEASHEAKALSPPRGSNIEKSQDWADNNINVTQRTPKRKSAYEPFTPNKSPTRERKAAQASGLIIVSPEKNKRPAMSLKTFTGKLPQLVYRVYSQSTKGQNSAEHGFIAESFTGTDDDEMPLPLRNAVELQNCCKNGSAYIMVLTSFSAAIAYAESLDDEHDILISEITAAELDKTGMLYGATCRKDLESVGLLDPDNARAYEEMFVCHHITQQAVRKTHNYESLRAELVEAGVLNTLLWVGNQHTALADREPSQEAVADALTHALSVLSLCDSEEMALIRDASMSFVVGHKVDLAGR